jgi:hypothetical protein
MAGKILVVLTFFVYLVLAVFNLQRVTATGERLMGWGFISLGILAIYMLCSLVLTIHVASTGGFNWISASAFSRNIAVSMVGHGIRCCLLYFYPDRLADGFHHRMASFADHASLFWGGLVAFADAGTLYHPP